MYTPELLPDNETTRLGNAFRHCRDRPKSSRYFGLCVSYLEAHWNAHGKVKHIFGIVPLLYFHQSP
jgi:hypothetical protein